MHKVEDYYFFMITLFVGLYVRVGILLTRVCSVIIFLLAVVLSILCCYGFCLPLWCLQTCLSTNQI